MRARAAPPRKQLQLRRERRTPVRFGFSLLELLIALAIVIAAAAVALPALDRVADERSFDAAVDDLDARLRRARAHAMRTGRAVEVAFERDDEDPDLVWLRVRHLDAEAEDQDAVAARRPGMRSDDPALVAAAWARRPLPTGITWLEADPLTDAAAGFDDAGAIRSDEEFAAFERDMERAFEDAAASFEARGASAIDGEDRRVIAVFLADGSALETGEVQIEDLDGRRARITVAPVSGLASCRRIVEDEADASGDARDGEGDDEGDDAADRDFRTDPAGESRDRSRDAAPAPRAGTPGSDADGGDREDAASPVDDEDSSR